MLHCGDFIHDCQDFFRGLPTDNVIVITQLNPVTFSIPSSYFD